MPSIWRRLRGLVRTAADPEERRRIDAELDRNRTDAIVATDRAKYGRRIADSPIERDLGRDQRER